MAFMDLEKAIDHGQGNGNTVHHLGSFCYFFLLGRGRYSAPDLA